MKKILLIDDDKDLNHLTKIVIAKSGHDVKVFHDAESGVNYAKTYKPDLVLMDIMLPGMSGTEAVKKIKSFDSSNEIKIIFLTATVSPRTKTWEEGLIVDGIQYPTVGKPYEIERLVQIVNKVLASGDKKNVYKS